MALYYYKSMESSFRNLFTTTNTPNIWSSLYMNSPLPTNMQTPLFGSHPQPSQVSSPDGGINSQLMAMINDYNANIMQYQRNMVQYGSFINQYHINMRELFRNINYAQTNAAATAAAATNTTTAALEEELARGLYTDIFNSLFRTGTSQTNATRTTVNNNLEQYYTETLYSVIRDSSGIEQNAMCPISMEEFREGEVICRLNRCSHTFKRQPLRRWLRNHNTCPVCRVEIIQNDNSYENLT